MTDGSQYDADYFLHGRETGKSLYSDYRWMPDLTIPMVCAMVRHLGIEPDDTVLDFGCARGYTVRAFHELGYHACGYDVSRWAIENADEVAKPYLVTNESTLLAGNFDWVIAKDVLEHVAGVGDTVNLLMEVAKKGVFVVVPLGEPLVQNGMYVGRQYAVREYEEDVTHLHRDTLGEWATRFMLPGWRVEASYRVKGIKDNYAQHPKGNGFVTARRIG